MKPRADEVLFVPTADLPLLVSATAAFVVHNHPSGSLEFSREDREMTGKLREGFSCIGIRLLDHMLIAGSGYKSYAQTYGDP